MVKLMSWNVNGLRAVHKKGLFTEVLKEQPDIICIQETKMQEDQMPPELVEQLPDYEINLASAERKGYSGVGTFSKLKSKSVRKGFGSGRFDTEGRVLINEFDDFTLFNIYYPNGKASSERLQYKLDFYDFFLDYVEKLRMEGKNLVICGDVNTAHKEIDLARPRDNETVSGFLPIEREWMDKFVGAGYVDTLRKFKPDPHIYTWWDMKSGARARNVGWRIDYFYVNQEFEDKVIEATVLPDYLGSDHCPITLTLDI